MNNRDFKFGFDVFSGPIWVTIFLAVLQISGAIDISIWWILSPILIMMGIILFIICIIFLIILNNMFSDIPDDDEYPGDV